MAKAIVGSGGNCLFFYVIEAARPARIFESSHIITNKKALNRHCDEIMLSVQAEYIGIKIRFSYFFRGLVVPGVDRKSLQLHNHENRK